MAVSTLMSVATAKLRQAFLKSSMSLMPMASPIPMIGPMSGDISMAPMMTAVELTFRPNDAMKMAKMSTHRLAPRKLTPWLICSITCTRSSMSGIMLK